jgi:tRNA nucleotidyltransferase (CCA-adding enzyme)
MLTDKDSIFVPDQIRQLIDLLNQAGYDCFVVGGYLRDLMLGRPTHDYDLATSATPEEVAKVLSAYRTLPTGLIHGTVSVHTEDLVVEMTTFRKEGSYSDFRHPDQVWFTESIEEDLARRDFTINAMAWHPSRGLIDPWGGRADLALRLIRAVGDPDRRFSEDALRILRALRFRSQLGFALESETSMAMGRKRQLLSHIAPERVRIELERLLAGPEAASVLEDYGEVMEVLIPQLELLRQSRTEDGLSSYELAVKRLTGLTADPVKRLAALLYDVDQLDCEGDAASIARDLRFSKKEIQEIDLLTRSKNEGLEAEERAVWRLLHHWGQKTFFDVLELRKADALARFPAGSDQEANLQEVVRLARKLISEGRALSLADLAVDGHELKAKGYQGPEIGLLLEKLLERVCIDGLSNDRESLLRELENQAW